MSSLFDDLPSIPGLICAPNFINEPSSLLATLDRMPWLDDLSRRVQHYGWRYDYKSRKIQHDAYLGPLPGFLRDVAEKLFSAGLLKCVPDQAIVNECLPGQGIAAHIDCEPCFGPEIAMISLGDDYPMRFTNVSTAQAIDVWLPVDSACVISGPARYEWRHEIAKRKSDLLGGTRKHRTRRVSVTFRTVIPR
ncbi:MAG: alpha-ketoglutarate-dependent dioxygenase AlkB [Fimbriimonadaceae bacterium]|nr:alpha-ketoglutarate-dependent dioxygenase AlkB [Fimbriimonadaceae bacterium]QYK58411.1 MAG: alpha-ketoglutarate-dependent dioxygenase AlkB [Fimbriimonadaceae bacterium]